ncbi:MAG: terpene cyclase/mutase family protein, partial [Kiritimatiellae bacterium]|nr:terpene cyclase/mutase family protein [Kiritimatiellia bacterium]
MNTQQVGVHPLQDPAFRKLMDLFKEPDYWQRLRLMLAGLGQPRNSGAYRRAHTELERQWAPLAAIAIPALCLLILALLAKDNGSEVPIIDIGSIEPIVDIEPQIQIDYPSTEPAYADGGGDFNPVIAMNKPALPPPPVIVAPPPERAPVNTPVSKGVSIITLPRIFIGSRSAPERARLSDLGQGNASTETAVIRALRWLKQNQQADGSWLNNKNAMTSLAILCFLAHDERPGVSREFGDSVQRGIEFLLRSQPADGQWPGNYEHFIAAYAMCEAYGMTMNPNLRASAERAVSVIIRGQHRSGGWDYAAKQSDRDDTSVTGWAAQALKAASMANFYSDPAALDRACKLTVQGLMRNAHPDGGFGYTGPG